MHAWGDGTADDKTLNDHGLTARRIREMGRLLTATEVRLAQRYWHVLHGKEATKSIYPQSYKPAAVGMMWNTSEYYMHIISIYIYIYYKYLQRQ